MRKWDLHQPAGPQLEVRITVGHALPILQIPHAWCATYVSSDWFLNNYQFCYFNSNPACLVETASFLGYVILVFFMNCWQPFFCCQPFYIGYHFLKSTAHLRYHTGQPHVAGVDAATLAELVRSLRQEIWEILIYLTPDVYMYHRHFQQFVFVLYFCLVKLWTSRPLAMNFGACPFPNPWSRSIANSGQLTWPKNHAW